MAAFALGALAWLYVALRYAHSAIHCTYNRVMHRFAVFIASMLVLFGTEFRQLQQARPDIAAHIEEVFRQRLERG